MMIGIGTPNSQSKIPRPISSSMIRKEKRRSDPGVPTADLASARARHDRLSESGMAAEPRVEQLMGSIRVEDGIAAVGSAALGPTRAR